MRGQLWVRGSSQNDVDIAQLPVVDVFLHQPDHAFLNIFAYDFSSRSHDVCQTPDMITDTGTDVGYNGTLLNIQRIEHAIGIFFSDAFRTGQPVRSLDTHHRRGLPSDLGLRLRYGDERKENCG